MSITIRNAILHIILNDGRSSVFSEKELDIDSELCEAFIQKHVKRLLDNPAAREAVFAADSALYAVISQYTQNGTSFRETANLIGTRLDEIMNRYVNIPPADLLIARVSVHNGEYLAVLKLNYLECYTHTINENVGTDNQLTKNIALPFNNGKVEDACLIMLGGENSAAMPLRLLEKPCLIDSEVLPYFSQLFLECDTTPSKKETAQVIEEITEEFIQEYYDNSPKAAARVKTAVVEEAEAEDGYVSMDNVAARVFEENDELKKQYVETLREAGIRADIPLGVRFAKSRFGTQRIKADNGVEVKFPCELAEDEDAVEITNHADGTVTVLLKRLRMV